MSNKQMVSVPRDELEAACQRFAKAQIFDFSRRMRALLAQPAEQTRGEPVGEVIAFSPGLHEIAWAKGYMPALGSKLYTHADPAEAERLRGLVDAKECERQQHLEECAAEVNALRAQLAERDALLREIHDGTLSGYARYSKIEAVLSASAEPRAPAELKAPELTDDLREILGRPNFTCHFIAKALRVMGHSIATKSEDEQAVVIHWLLGIYLKHGSDWRQRASAELEEASKALRS